MRSSPLEVRIAATATRLASGQRARERAALAGERRRHRDSRQHLGRSGRPGHAAVSSRRTLRAPSDRNCPPEHVVARKTEQERTVITVN